MLTTTRRGILALLVILVAATGLVACGSDPDSDRPVETTSATHPDVAACRDSLLDQIKAERVEVVTGLAYIAALAEHIEAVHYAGHDINHDHEVIDEVLEQLVPTSEDAIRASGVVHNTCGRQVYKLLSDDLNTTSCYSSGRSVIVSLTKFSADYVLLHQTYEAAQDLAIRQHGSESGVVIGHDEPVLEARFEALATLLDEYALNCEGIEGLTPVPALDIEGLIPRLDLDSISN